MRSATAEEGSALQAATIKNRRVGKATVAPNRREIFRRASAEIVEGSGTGDATLRDPG